MRKLSITHLFIFAFCMFSACATPESSTNDGSDQNYDNEQGIAVSNKANVYFLEGGAAYEAQDYDDAEVLLRKAAVLGHYKAEFILGTMYEDGKSVPQSNVLAAEWYQKSADQGYIKAKARLRILQKKSTGN